MSQNTRIIIIDDEPALRVVLARLVRRILPEAEIVTTLQGLEAVRACIQQPTTCVITDYHMQGLSGLEIARLVTSLKEPPYVVLVSGSLPAQDAMRDAGVGVALTKPVTLVELQAALTPIINVQDQGL